MKFALLISFDSSMCCMPTGCASAALLPMNSNVFELRMSLMLFVIAP